MEQWREVHVKFYADGDDEKNRLRSFISDFTNRNPGCVDPSKEEFSVFGWIRKWDDDSFEFNEDEGNRAFFGFHNDVLPFFEQLHEALPDVGFDGKLIRFENVGELSKQTRTVRCEDGEFTTSVDYWFEDEEEATPCEESGEPVSSDESVEELLSPLGTIAKSGRANTHGNVFSWALSEQGTLAIFSESSEDVVAGFDADGGPWSSFSDEIVKVRFLNRLRAESLSYLFASCYSLEDVEGLAMLDTSHLKNIKGLFVDCESIEHVDLSPLDTSNVSDMEELFSGCASLQEVDFSQIDTSNVTNMNGIIAGCESLEEVDLSPLDTSHVTDMGCMLMGLGIETVDLSPLDTSNVTNMAGLFSYCTNLRQVDLSPLDTSKVTDMSQMFNRCEALESIDLSPLDTSNATNMLAMFGDCTSLEHVDLSPIDFSNVTDMAAMFENCSSLESVDLSTSSAPSVKGVSSMFAGCEAMKSVNLAGWDEIDWTFSGLKKEWCVGNSQ